MVETPGYHGLASAPQRSEDTLIRSTSCVTSSATELEILIMSYGTPFPDPSASVSPQQYPPAPRKSKADRWELLKPRIRLIGSAVIAALALLTLVAFSPTTPAADFSADRASTWAEDSVNQENTTGAPQQQVVNGWTANALLDLISEQLDEQPPPDQRPAVLLMLGVLMLALMAATTPAPKAHPRGESWNAADGAWRPEQRPGL